LKLIEVVTHYENGEYKKETDCLIMKVPQ